MKKKNSGPQNTIQSLPAREAILVNKEIRKNPEIRKIRMERSVEPPPGLPRGILYKAKLLLASNGHHNLLVY